MVIILMPIDMDALKILLAQRESAYEIRRCAR
jgi:hypothetical protein